MSQHAGLTPERWRRHSLGQQLLMIANEMNRASKLFAPSDRDRLRASYERVLSLVDLTIQVNEGRAFRRELLRWRDLAGEQYVSPAAEGHAVAFRALLQLHPETWAQRAYVTGAATF